MDGVFVPSTDGVTQSVPLIRNATDDWANKSTTEFDDPCWTYDLPYLHLQFWFIGVAGFLFAACALALNILLMWFFLRSGYFRKSSYFYFWLLGGVDTAHCFFYIAVFSMAVIYESSMNTPLMRLWHSYVIPFTGLDYIIMSGSSYLIVSASIERVVKLRRRSFLRPRPLKTLRALLLCVSLLISVGTCGTIFWEFQVLQRPDCPPMAQRILVPSALGENELFHVFWVFWIRNIFTLFLPFLLLLFLHGSSISFRGAARSVQRDFQRRFSNITGTNSLNPASNRNSKDEATTSIQKKRDSANANGQDSNLVGSELNNTHKNNNAAKSPEMEKNPMLEWIGLLAPPATSTGSSSRSFRSLRERLNRRAKGSRASKALICIVIEYLISNGLGVFLTVWETVDKESLAERPKFYALCSDTVSLLTVIVPALRLPLYLLCDPRMRRDFRRTLKEPLCRKRHAGLDGDGPSALYGMLQGGREPPDLVISAD